MNLANKNKYVAAVLLTIASTACLATGQRGDLIIYQGDTLTLLCEPLEPYLQNHEPREQFFPALKDGCSTALWRGYVGIWAIIDDRLMLLDIFACGDKSSSITKRIFTDHPDDEAIFASWFTGQLFIEKGRVIKYHHSGYDRYYEHETIVNVVDGLITETRSYKNGIQENDHAFTRNLDTIQHEIYRRIRWDNLPKLNKDRRLIAEICLNQGRVIVIDSTIGKTNLEHIYKLTLMNAIAGIPPIQVFYSRGEPLSECYYMLIIFSRQNKRRFGR